ncbi:mitoferrin-1 isoform X1 [Ochotona princeps]|uniref:mitoferrin-1 isoform X1 n=1 Tax=Ochotona princeps TaxID=9978 RepID=UPI00271512D6|nr:mitoferrin-1 isoform X1 [Ochotona princeps]
MELRSSGVGSPAVGRGMDGDSRDGGGGGKDAGSEDYENLPTSASVSTHMTAGAMAGILEHSVMYPVDSVKTRMQSLNPDPKAQYTSIYGALRKIMRTEGFWRPLRGLNVMVMGAGPAHAMYFACYENMKRTLNDVFNHQGNSHLANGIAGSMATLLHDAVMNPAEVVKQRMQMYNSQHRPSISSPMSSCRSRSTLTGATTRSPTSSQADWPGPWLRLPPPHWTSVKPSSTPRRTWHSPWPTSVAGYQAWLMPSGRCTSSTAWPATSRASRPVSSTRCPPQPSPGPSMSSSSTSSRSTSWTVELHSKGIGYGKGFQNLGFSKSCCFCSHLFNTQILSAGAPHGPSEPSNALESVEDGAATNWKAVHRGI